MENITNLLTMYGIVPILAGLLVCYAIFSLIRSNYRMAGAKKDLAAAKAKLKDLDARLEENTKKLEEQWKKRREILKRMK